MQRKRDNSFSLDDKPFTGKNRSDIEVRSIERKNAGLCSIENFSL